MSNHVHSILRITETKRTEKKERKTTHYKQIKFTIASVYFNFNNSGIDVLYTYMYIL